MELPQNLADYTPFRAHVARVISGKYDRSSVTIAPQTEGNCSFLNEENRAVSGCFERGDEPVYRLLAISTTFAATGYNRHR